jgi:hypothetical protein
MWTRTMGVALVSVLMAWPAAAQNAVNDWSLKAQNVITAGRSPASSEYLLALVHAAMYDAVVAIQGEYRPFRVKVDVDRPASPDAAVAAAAYHVLRHRVPASEPALTAEYLAYVSALPAGLAREQGIQAGAAVAMQWLALRANDRFDLDVTYQPPAPGPGVWEPTATTPPVDVKIAQVQPYVMQSPDRFRPDGPRGLQSRAYARAFDEAYDLGRLDSVGRTAEQLEVARFWAEHTAVQWNRNLRQLAAGAQLDIVSTARLLAMVHVASADATVGCFDAKYGFLFWRPVHAIRRADTDGNPRTTPDVSWDALLNVNHPEYPSAHSCWTQAVTDTLAYFFGTDQAEFGLDSTVTGSTRQYARFSEVAEEVQDARVWAGIHFRFSTDDGATIGRQVARLVARDHFRPVKH